MTLLSKLLDSNRRRSLKKSLLASLKSSSNPEQLEIDEDKLPKERDTLLLS